MGAPHLQKIVRCSLKEANIQWLNAQGRSASSSASPSRSVSLSAYMASSGKHYANHYATIRKWLDEDSKSRPGKNYDYTETYEEGECL